MKTKLSSKKKLSRVKIWGWYMVFWQYWIICLASFSKEKRKIEKQIFTVKESLLDHVSASYC